MRNLIPYNDDCFLFHKAAVNQKNAGALKKRLIGLDNLVEAEYKVFEKEFQNNSIGNIEANAILQKSMEDLLSIYGYNTKSIRGLRKHIKATNFSTVSSTCQNCTVDSINSMDHILPQSLYPEFIVHPKNLFPCCTTCNSIKNNAIAKGDYQPFINLYLDTLPQEQYLYVNIIFDNEKGLDFEFLLKNDKCKIDDSFFVLLKNHYSKLNLFIRMKEKSLELITAFQNDVKNFSNYLPFEQVVKINMDTVNENLSAYGYNHWFFILQKALLQSPFFELLINEMKKSNPQTGDGMRQVSAFLLPH